MDDSNFLFNILKNDFGIDLYWYQKQIIKIILKEKEVKKMIKTYKFLQNTKSGGENNGYAEDDDII